MDQWESEEGGERLDQTDHRVLQDHSDQGEVREDQELMAKEEMPVTRVIKVGLEILDFRAYQERRVTAEMPDHRDHRDFEETEAKAVLEVVLDLLVQTEILVFRELRDLLGHLVTTVDRVLLGLQVRPVLLVHQLEMVLQTGILGLVASPLTDPRDRIQCMAMIQMLRKLKPTLI